MLSSVHLVNYKGFEDHEIALHQRTLLVGPNNAGKSTIVEALRLLSLVANRQGLQARPVPAWLGEEAAAPTGVSPSLAGMDLELGRESFHRYADPPALITGSYENGAKIDLFIGPDEQVFAVVRDSKGAVVRSPAQRRAAGLGLIGVQPQVGPLRRFELERDPRYVRRALDSALAPLHFQNQVLTLDGHWDEFRSAAESTWPQLQLHRPEVVDDHDASRGVDVKRISMLVRDGGFTGELSSMGHGLQMWLQMLWFLTRARGAGTLVLDEPDVYMHADLQRKLIRFLASAKREQQLVIATHSVEMMAEVEASEVVVIDAGRRRSRQTRTTADLQRVISDLGGVHTIQYARLWTSKRCLLVEGKDLDVLKPLHDLLHPSADALDVSARFSIGGWAGWEHGVGIARFVREGDRDVAVTCVLDPDYRWPGQLEARREAARKQQIRLHIWTRKEIENYLLEPEVIRRVIAKRCQGAAPSLEDITSAMEQAFERLKPPTIKGFLDSHPDNGLSPSTQYDEAEQHVAHMWTAFDAKRGVVSGKQVRSLLSSWSQENFNCSFGTGSLVREMRLPEIPFEVARVLNTIESRDSADQA